MNKVRWGVLGCASFARRRTIPALLQTTAAELRGVASRSAEKAESFRREFGLERAYGSYEELLNDDEIQVVYNPLPNGLHAAWMIRTAEKGKHTLCEKPFASDAEEARRVADAASAAGVLVMEGFMWRFHPQHERARTLVQSGRIGRVCLVRAAFSFTLPAEPNVRLRRDLAGGSVMDVGCYPVSASRFYFGSEPRSAYALCDTHPAHGVDMRMTGLLEFEGGRAAIDSGHDLPYRGELEIVGEQGIIRIPQPWQPDEEACIVVDGRKEALPRANQYVNQFEHFSRCVLHGTPARYGPEDAILQMKAIDAVRRSMRTGRPEPV